MLGRTANTLPGTTIDSCILQRDCCTLGTSGCIMHGAYDIAVFASLSAGAVVLLLEIVRLRGQLRVADKQVQEALKESKNERERLIGVLAAVQSEKVQVQLGLMTDSELRKKNEELAALKASFQSSD